MKRKLEAPRIKHVSVDWSAKWDNRPTWEVAFTRPIEWKDFVFEEPRENRILGFYGDAAEFKSYGGERGTGYGGAHFTFKMRNGETITWIGPWSSNASSVNSVYPEDPVVEVVDVTEGPCRVSSAVRISALAQWLKQAQNEIGLVLLRSGGRELYEPTWFGYVKPERFERDMEVIKVLVDTQRKEVRRHG